MNAKLWIKIDIDGRGQIGPGKIALLKAIIAHKSIAGAARSLKMSYRRAWLLVESMNVLFAEPVVKTRIGGSNRGGAAVTATGLRVIQLYDEIDADANRATRARLARCFASLGNPDPS